MAAKAGVWVDHKQAIVVLVSEAGPEIKKVAFDLGKPVRSEGSPRTKKKHTPNDFIAEDRRDRKVENDRKDYYDDVIASLGVAKSILILGPGEAKGELSKRIQSKKLRGVTVELETTDKLTERQLAAKVGAHFATAPASKSVAQRKAAKIKTATPAARKSTKKNKN